MNIKFTFPITLILADHYVNNLNLSSNYTKTEENEEISTIKHFKAFTCADLWLNYGVRKSDIYILQLSDQMDNKNYSVLVECDMTDALNLNQDVDAKYLNPNEQAFEVKTIIHHDSEEPHLVQGYESPGSFERNIIYNHNANQMQPIEIIINSSFTCQQYIRWDCKGSVFSFWFQHYHSWWLDRYGRTQTYWGNAEPDSNSCGCFPYCHPTVKNSTCNCDANMKADWLEDSGLLLIKDRLPVTQLRFGDTGESYEVGKYTLGPLICRTFGHRKVDFGQFQAPVTIVSPGYPFHYPPEFRRYQWLILVEQGQFIEMVFSEYNVVHYGSYVSVPGCRYALEVDIYQQKIPKEIKTIRQFQFNETDWIRIYSIKREKSSPPYYVTDGQRTLFLMRFITCNQNRSLVYHHKGFKVEFRESKCSACNIGGLTSSTGSVKNLSTNCFVQSEHCLYLYSDGYPFPHYLYGKNITHEPIIHHWNISTINDHILQIEFNDFDVFSTPGQHYCDADLVTIKNGTKIVDYCNINRFNIGKFNSDSNQIDLVFRTSRKKVGNSRGIHVTINSMPKIIRLPSSNNNRWVNNAAEGRPTDQSSTRSPRDSSLAVDNNYEQNDAAKCSSTNYEREPWWRVNLQKRHRIYGVTIYSYRRKQQESISLNVPNSVLCPKCDFEWPPGNYGLPMPVSGCPSDNIWKTGMRFHAIQHDKPYDDKTRYWSDNIMLKGGATKYGIEQHFCIHQQSQNENPEYNGNETIPTWQPGKYCIFQYGYSCPDGFHIGSLTWFDKNPVFSASKYYNSINGTLPRGEYTTHNTTIYFCCREDGDPTKPINLPRTRPFYLFQYGRICQEVAGMSEMEHFFHFEEEVLLNGSIPDLVFISGQRLKFQDPHPRIEVTLFDRGLTLHYCYYDIADKLKGFQVLIDTTPDTFGYGRFYDIETGISRSINKPFLSAVECASYSTIEQEFDHITLNCNQPIEGQYVIIFMKDRQDALQLCEVLVFGEETCGRPLGMATEEILDSAITASSFDASKGLVYHPYNVRLNSFAAWCTNNNDPEKYIQIDLRLQNSNVFDSKIPPKEELDDWNEINYVTLVGIAMQGMPHGFKSYFITHFQVLFSNDSINWTYEEEPIGKQKVYKCVQCEAQHVDPNEIVMYNLLKPVVARFLRIKILSFRGGPCMRLELIGCRGDKKNFCSRTLTASTPGIISSPNYPFYYAQYKSCVWHIKPQKPNGHIELDFIVLDLAPPEKSGGKCHDNLYIDHSPYQSSPIIIEASADSLQHQDLALRQNFPKKIISNGELKLKLNTCFRFTMTRYQGFLVRFRETDCPGCGIGDSRCSRVHNCNSLCGQIFSINYPLNYLNNHRCRWFIRAPSGYYFNITIEDFDITGSASYPIKSNRSVKHCLFDHLSFIDPSTGIILGRYCNNNKPSKYILSNWNELLIEFSTDSNGNGRGFKLKYTAQRYQLLPEAIPLLTLPNACPVGWLYFRGYCYAIFTEKESLQWYEAEEKCAQKVKGRDGHLVSITDYLEMNVIHYWIIEQWKLSSHESIYIGLIDTNREGFYNWSDGNPMSYTDWYRNNLLSYSFTSSSSSSISNQNWSSLWLANNNDLSSSSMSSLINLNGDNQYLQPDGGAFEDCTVINFHSIHSTLNWHDVPCSLGKKVIPSKLNISTDFNKSFSNNITEQSNLTSTVWSSMINQNRNHHDGLIRSYICKMDSNSSLHQHSPRKALFTSDGFSEIEKKLIRSKVDLNRYFVCNNYEVISNLFRCDGTANCRDGSDEMEGCFISNQCLESQFQCANGHCIAIGKYCDFIDDCGDGSDEIFCVRPPCKKNTEFKCNNNQCIPQYKRCDLFHDCRDQSDEDTCNGKCNLNTTFQCYYGNCIPLYALCDRHRDCPGKFFEDEHETVCSALNSGEGLGYTVSISSGSNQKTESYRWRRGSSKTLQYLRRSTENHKQNRRYRRHKQLLCENNDKNQNIFTCQDLLEYRGITLDGYYDLQPLSDSKLTLKVYCRFLNSTHATTIINHDTEDRLYVRSSFDAPGSYVRTIIYEESFDLIVAIIDSSASCRQFVSYECSGSKFNFNTPRPNSWWISRYGSKEYSWGTDRINSCACYPNCISNLNCNCDAGLMFNWTRDYGYVEDRSKLPIRQVAFGEVSKIGQLGYVQVGPVECIGKQNKSNNKINQQQKNFAKNDFCKQNSKLFQCNSGQIIDSKHICIYEFDELQYQIGCRDVSHLRNCKSFQCPSDYVKCPDSYCIPYRYICNGKWDCIGGLDEIGCAKYSCPGRYKCANESSCIWLHQLCDGSSHCPLGDDEWFCDLNCPKSCICNNHYVNCQNSNITVEILKNISRETRKLDLSNNNLGPDLSFIDFSSYTYLGELILQNNNLEIIRSRKFIQLTNLYKLDLRYNRIKVIEAAAFAGLQQVTTLMLDHNNQLTEIHSGAFVGLVSLRRLNISNTQLKNIAKNLFLQMSSLQQLTLSNNKIDIIEKGAFNDLTSLMSLDLRGNPITNFSKDMFVVLKSLRNLATDSFKFCCMASGIVPFNRCYPPQDEISDCEDLMSNTVQRLILWILGFGALFGNLIVIVWRFKTRNQTNRVSSTLILWLGFSDFLMGIYLLIIASVDEYYRGHYIENSDYWKNSIWCKLCGFLSTLSSETSVATLVFITIDRLISISFSFSNYRFNVNCTYRLLILTWIIMLFISGLPLLPFDYFKGQFYSRSGVCLAFHITALQWPGWEYSVAIFLVLNLIAFLFILSCYLYMYNTIAIAVKKRQQMRAKQIRETKIGLQMALIIITNFLCWFPVIIMGFMALGGIHIPGAAYSWIAVLVLPLNSATNPLIYTLLHFVPNLLYQTQKRTDLISMSNRNMVRNSLRMMSIKQQNLQDNRNLSLVPTSLIQPNRLPMKILMQPPPGYQTLNDFLRNKNTLTPKDLLEICYSLSKTLKDFHQMGYVLGNINIDNIFVTEKPIIVEEQIQNVNIELNENFVEENNQKYEYRLRTYVPPFNSYQVPGSGADGNSSVSSEVDDFAVDMEEFGKIVKRMLQIYHSRTLRESQCSFTNNFN